MLAVLVLTCAGAVLTVVTPTIEDICAARFVRVSAGVAVSMAFLVMRDAVDTGKFGLCTVPGRTRSGETV